MGLMELRHESDAILILTSYIILLFSSVVSYKVKNLLKLKFPYIVEVIHAFLTSVIFLPLFVIFLGLTGICRSLLSVYFKYAKCGKIKLMNGNDAFWSYEEYASASNITVLFTVQGECDIVRIKMAAKEKFLESMLDGEETYNKLKYKAVIKFGFYCWEKVHFIDMDHHIRVISNHNGQSMTEIEVFNEVARIYDTPLHSDKPQWEVLIVPNYVYMDNHEYGNTRNHKYYAIILRLHHSYMDGVSASFILQNGLADNPPKLYVNPLSTQYNIPFLKKLLVYSGLILLGPRSLLRTLMLEEENIFHGKSLTGPKVIGWTKPIQLKTLTAIKKITKTSVTSILISALGGSLKSLALKKQKVIPPVLNSFATVAILPYPDTKPQNRFAVALFPIHLGLSTSKERLKAAYKDACQLARSPDVLFSFFTMKVTGLLPWRATKFISDTAHATVLITNVPGPSEVCTVLGGNIIEDIGVWAPTRSRMGLAMGIFSYKGKLRISLIGDCTALSEPTDLSHLVHTFEEEIIDMYENVGLLLQ